MKIFAIRDESAVNQIDLAYLLYYEVEKHFYIELPENADPWETPLLLSSFVKKGEEDPFKQQKRDETSKDESLQSRKEAVPLKKEALADAKISRNHFAR